MQSKQNLSSSHVVCLKSFDGFNTLCFTVHGYQFPQIDTGSDSNWYSVAIEYRSGGLQLLCKTSDFDAQSFGNFRKALSRINGEQMDERTLLQPPYGQECEIFLVSQTAELRRPRIRAGKVRYPRFARGSSGLFVQGQVRGLKFKFKVTTAELKRCRDELSLVVKELPERYCSRGLEISPVKIIEAKFQGAEVSEGVTKWMASWIEDDIRRLSKPLFRAIKRNARRKNLSKYTVTKMIASAQTRCRNQIITSWRR